MELDDLIEDNTSEFVTNIYDRLIFKINGRFNTIAKRKKDIKIVEYIIQCIPMYIPMKTISSGFDIAIWPTSARENSHGNSRPRIVMGFRSTCTLVAGNLRSIPFSTGKKLSGKFT